MFNTKRLDKICVSTYTDVLAAMENAPEEPWYNDWLIQKALQTFSLNQLEMEGKRLVVGIEALWDDIVLECASFDLWKDGGRVLELGIGMLSCSCIFLRSERDMAKISFPQFDIYVSKQWSIIHTKLWNSNSIYNVN